MYLVAYIGGENKSVEWLEVGVKSKIFTQNEQISI